MKRQIVVTILLLVLTVACSKSPSQNSDSASITTGAQVYEEGINKINQINLESEYSLSKEELDELLVDKAITQNEYDELLKLTVNKI